MTSDRLDALDRRILDIIQTAFPIARRPYAVLGEQLGISEEEAFRRVSAMRKNGLVRRIGANFQSSSLGFFSTLCAAKVPAEKLDAFVDSVNALPGVTHNYEREHEYNIWFTLISPSPAEARTTLDELVAATGVDILNLPATLLFKIRVDFPMGRD